MKYRFWIFAILIALCGKAQQHKAVHKIAVFAPVHLDSAFDGNTFKLTGNNLPKAILPGLDFYNGVMMAVDSLQKENAALEILFLIPRAVKNLCLKF